jgi:hypothetical protein
MLGCGRRTPPLIRPESSDDPAPQGSSPDGRATLSFSVKEMLSKVALPIRCPARTDLERKPDNQIRPLSKVCGLDPCL